MDPTVEPQHARRSLRHATLRIVDRLNDALR